MFLQRNHKWYYLYDVRYQMLVLCRTTEASFLSFPLSQEQKHFYRKHCPFYIFSLYFAEKEEEKECAAT